MRSDRGLQRGFESDGAREEDIVLQVNALVEVLLELLKATEEGEVGWARPGGRSVLMAEFANLGKRAWRLLNAAA